MLAETYATPATVGEIPELIRKVTDEVSLRFKLSYIYLYLFIYVFS